MQTRTTADPDEREHFTKFCSANDPDEVYAACHRCDKLLKAHPKKHGTSHLIGHIHTCSSCTNPSTDEDREMLHHLRTALDNPYEQQKMMDEKLNCQEDLTQLNPCEISSSSPPAAPPGTSRPHSTGKHVRACGWRKMRSSLQSEWNSHKCGMRLVRSRWWICRKSR